MWFLRVRLPYTVLLDCSCVASCSVHAGAVQHSAAARCLAACACAGRWQLAESGCSWWVLRCAGMRWCCVLHDVLPDHISCTLPRNQLHLWSNKRVRLPKTCGLSGRDCPELAAAGIVCCLVFVVWVSSLGRDSQHFFLFPCVFVGHSHKHHADPCFAPCSSSS